MSHRVRKHLRIDIDAYDETIRRFIPGYETMLAVATEAVAVTAPDLVRDLGAGTGALSEALLTHPAVGAVELLDVDPEMMDKARQRLGRFGDRARFTLRSYDEAFSPCDAYAASLSLHHIPTIEARSALYERAFATLPGGGIFVNTDPYLPVGGAQRDKLFRAWADHLVASGIAEDRAWRHFEEWAEEDHYQPLEVELEALTRVGFSAACVWTEGPIGVVVATKPS